MARQGWRYFRVVAAGFFAAIVVIILLNALVWQRTRHPAPLFSRAGPVARKKEPRIAEMIANPTPRPQPAVPPVEVRERPIEKPPAQKTLLEKPPRETPADEHPRHTRVKASPVKQRDRISQLLKAPPAPRARSTTAAKAASAASAAPSKSVLAAQRALVKLGFVLKPDGVAGMTTRRAIESYERDHGLPIRGELTPALMRRLSTESGITGAR